MKINHKIKNFKKILLASLLLTALLSFFYNCKKSPTTPELPPSGSIQVNSTPTGATIWLDGSNTGKTTNALLTNISAGPHVIKLTKDCHEDFETTVTVEKNQSATVNAELEKMVPILIAPEDGAVMDNGRSDGKDHIIWWFDWSDVIGATKYHLYVIRPDGHTAIDKDDCNESCWIALFPNIGIVSGLFNWKWKVRAFIDDRWCGWSEVRSFDLEPINTDPPS